MTPGGIHIKGVSQFTGIMTNRMRNRLKSLQQVEDHRARITLDLVCEFMRTVPEETNTRDIALVEFQQRVGARILSPNGNAEYEKYKKKYRQLKKEARQKSGKMPNDRPLVLRK